jgi:hypothetical protein
MTAAARTRLARRQVLCNAWLLALAVCTYGFSAPAVLAVDDLADQIPCAGMGGPAS